MPDIARCCTEHTPKYPSTDQPRDNKSGSLRSPSYPNEVFTLNLKFNLQFKIVFERRDISGTHESNETLKNASRPPEYLTYTFLSKTSHARKISQEDKIQQYLNNFTKLNNQS